MSTIHNGKDKLTFRRLLLSKEFYLHGLEHSRLKSPLNRMIAIHNFHNSLEIVLRSIFLYHEIRPEKQLNIDFESMLNAIDSFQSFKENNVKLPYRQELRSLNQIRNMVQHQAVEPEESTLDDWRVFTIRFLREAFDTYFSINFDEVTSIHFIHNKDLKNLLLTGNKLNNINKYLDSVVAAKLAFIYASYAISNFLPSDGLNSDFFVISSISSITRNIDTILSHKIENVIRKIYDKIGDTKLYSSIISSGVSLADYKQYEMLTPSIILTLDGGYVVQTMNMPNPDFESSSWILNFVEQSIIKWQLSGIDLNLNERLAYSCKKSNENLSANIPV